MINKEKLLKWIEMRIEDHKEKKKVIYDREFAEPFDAKTHAYHVGAHAELAFLRECITQHKAFDKEVTPCENATIADTTS